MNRCVSRSYVVLGLVREDPQAQRLGRRHDLVGDGRVLSELVQLVLALHEHHADHEGLQVEALIHDAFKQGQGLELDLDVGRTTFSQQVLE